MLAYAVLAFICMAKSESFRLFEQNRRMYKQNESFSREYLSQSYKDDIDEHKNTAPIKTVYVPKSQRETLKEKGKVDIQMKDKEKERQYDTKKMIAEALRVDRIKPSTPIDHVMNRSHIDPMEIDTDDDINEEEGFEEWKRRETARLAREAEISEKTNKNQPYQASFQFASKTDKADQKRVLLKHRTKMKFLQKYYHKGAFFQTNTDDKFGSTVANPIYERDYRVPTTADNFDKTLLPVVMQVKNFGRRGRTKWTHLVAEDTSNQESLPMALGVIRTRRATQSEIVKPKRQKNNTVNA